MQQLTTLRSRFKFHSGRVISLGRLMLATTLFVVMMFGRTRVELTENYPFLIAYAAAGGLIAVITWKNWWLDARLATFTHGIDMAVFTAIVFSLANAVLLAIRIRAEEAALGASYARVFFDRPRFVPGGPG